MRNNKPVAAETIFASPVDNKEATDAIESLIGEFGNPDPEITVEVASKTFVFLALVDRAKFNALQRRATAFSELKTAPPAMPEVKAWMETDANTKMYAFMLAELSQRPKLDPWILLKLAKHACFAFEAMKNGYFKALFEARVEAEGAEIEARGKEFGGTSPGATA